jgi:hypothetical protein
MHWARYLTAFNTPIMIPNPVIPMAEVGCYGKDVNATDAYIARERMLEYSTFCLIDGRDAHVEFYEAAAW